MTLVKNPHLLIEKVNADEINSPPQPALCRGLTHRTVAGRRRCAERAAATGSKRSSTDALEYTGEREEEENIRCQKDSLLNHDQRDHFYYLDGVMRRVRSNLYPFYRRRR